MELIEGGKNSECPLPVAFSNSCNFMVYVNVFSLFWLIAGGQLFLFISKTQGFWFDGIYGIATGILGIVSILTTIIVVTKQAINIKKLCLFLLFIILLTIPLIMSGKIAAGDNDAIRKALTLLPYVFVPSLWGLVFPRNVLKKEYAYWIPIALLLIGNIFLYRYYSGMALSHFIRAGEEANAIGLSYAFANLWVILLGSIIIKGKIFLFMILSAVSILNIFILSTRQTLIYLGVFIVSIFFIYIIPITIYKKKPLKIYLSKKKIWRIFFAIIFLLTLAIILIIICNSVIIAGPIKISINTAFSRWLSFIDSGYVDKARIELFENAKAVWMENPVFGLFSYHEPGNYAHHMIMDWLAEYGLTGAITYLFFIILSIINITKNIKLDVYEVCFSIMFVGLLSIGMLVTQLTTDPIFHFLLFYWIVPKNPIFYFGSKSH